MPDAIPDAMPDAMSDASAALLAAWHLGLRELLLLTAVAIAVSGLDDLFIDVVYFTRVLWRRLTVYSRHRRATAQSLRRADPAPMAILVPAWDESAVIGAMLTATLARLDYPHYRLFVGVYPNDPAGRAAVGRVHDRRVEMVVCSRPGPTTKADCLNHLWAAALGHEASSGERFKAIVLHDAEDVVHPQELWVFDALVPRLALVQLPVLPLPDRDSRWVSGHYLDEFAENHTKDMVVREALGAAVPSAGVACAFDRDCLARIAAGRDDAGPFDAESLTEDYELGHRIKAMGGRAGLVRVYSGDERVVVSTREHFPATFDAALRQKSRWLIGIALSGWDRLGWQGGLGSRYMLLRDRKALPVALFTAMGYALAALVAVDWAVRRQWPAAAALPPLVGPGLARLLWANAGLLGWRLLLRAGFTAHAHGMAEGILAIPRSLASNIINAAAAWAAIRRYRAIVAGRDQQRWDKTAHRFPAGEAMAAVSPFAETLPVSPVAAAAE
jgi:adsorption protein B